MTKLDWHQDRRGLVGVDFLEGVPASQPIDLQAVRTYRLARLRDQMKQRDIAALILSDPVNIRYATGSRNMQVFTSRNAPSRYLLLTEHQAILHEFTGCMHLAAGLETLTEIRPALTASFVAAGPAIAERERHWAGHVADTLRELVGRERRVGMERLNAGAALALAEQGYRLVDAQESVEMARAIKSSEELKCVVASLRATEFAVEMLRQAMRPGLTENALWSVLHQAVIAQDGDYCETRLLNSGPRTNPWFQECSPRVIGENELVALDTDVVGCHGYYADFSRSFHVGPNRPSDQQKRLHDLALEQVTHNMALLKPGVSFREYAEKAWDIPEAFWPNRYYLSAHGCGMSGEYPYLYHRADFPEAGYDGVIEPGMTLCVESYLGADGGVEGVKLEQQVLITESGAELLSFFPYEELLTSGG